MSKHTPGPWGWDEDDRWVREVSTGATIAAVEEDDGHCDSPRPMPAEANARLIAAAPDLLEALRETADYLQAAFGLVAGDAGDDDWTESMDDEYGECTLAKRVLAAICKATGRGSGAGR